MHSTTGSGFHCRSWRNVFHDMSWCGKHCIRVRSVACRCLCSDVFHLFSWTVRGAVSPPWPLPARERPRFAARHTPWTHTPNLCARRTRIPPLLSPGLSGNQGRVSRLRQSLPRRPLEQSLAVQTNARGGAQYPFGLYSTETRDSEKHPGITVLYKVSPRLKDCLVSFIQPCGWKIMSPHPG